MTGPKFLQCIAMEASIQVLDSNQFLIRRNSFISEVTTILLKLLTSQMRNSISTTGRLSSSQASLLAEWPHIYTPITSYSTQKQQRFMHSPTVDFLSHNIFHLSLVSRELEGWHRIFSKLLMKKDTASRFLNAFNSMKNIFCVIMQQIWQNTKRHLFLLQNLHMINTRSMKLLQPFVNLKKHPIIYTNAIRLRDLLSKITEKPQFRPSKG